MKKLLVGIILTIVAVLGIFAIVTTGIPSGKTTLQYNGASVQLTEEEAASMRNIFRFKLYNEGIGGCPFEKDIAITIGDTVYAIALDGCHCAKNWDKEKCVELSDQEYQMIANLFQKYCGDTLIY